MPRDGFAFAVRIGSQIEFVGILELGFELRNLLLLVRIDHVIGLEVIFQVDGELADRGLLQFRRQLRGLRKVPDMTDRGIDDEAVAQVLGDRLTLGR